jgi:hypothetical protein
MTENEQTLLDSIKLLWAEVAKLQERVARMEHRGTVDARSPYDLSRRT